MPATVEIFPHTATGALDLAALEQLAQASVALVLPHPGSEPSSLTDLAMVEVSLVDDASISEVHGQFLQDPTATDVITFHHGELIISYQTALRQAPLHGHTEFQETLLYIVHGLLHLHGHEDASTIGAAEMARLQGQILEHLLGE